MELWDTTTHAAIAVFANDGGACHAKQVLYKQVLRLLVKNKHACSIIYIYILICSIMMACRAYRNAFDRPPLCEEKKKIQNTTTHRIRCLAGFSLFSHMALYTPRRSRSRTRPCFKRGSLWIGTTSIASFISVDGDSHMLQLSRMYSIEP